MNSRWRNGEGYRERVALVATCVLVLSVGAASFCLGLLTAINSRPYADGIPAYALLAALPPLHLLWHWRRHVIGASMAQRLNEFGAALRRAGTGLGDRVARTRATPGGWQRKPKGE